MTNDDVIHRSRLRLFALAREMGSVRAACRLLGVHHSTYYRWRRQLVRFGPELLRPRERRQPRMPNAIPPMVEQRILGLDWRSRAGAPTASAWSSVGRSGAASRSQQTGSGGFSSGTG